MASDLGPHFLHMSTKNDAKLARLTHISPDIKLISGLIRVNVKALKAGSPSLIRLWFKSLFSLYYIIIFIG